MKQIIGLVVALQIVLCGHAWACTGQVGKVIFEDDFSDDSGGWPLIPPISTIKPPELIFALSSKKDSTSSINQTFRAIDGDYCVEFNLPKSLDGNNSFGLNLMFWIKDSYNFMSFGINSNSTVFLASVTDNKVTYIFTQDNAPGYKSGSEAFNTIRVIVKSGRLTLMLNGNKLKVIRAQVPEGVIRFGIGGFMNKGIDNAPPIRVKSYKVTAGE